MTETRDERRERKVPEIIYRLDAKVYHGRMSVPDALEAAYAAGLERLASLVDGEHSFGDWGNCTACQILKVIESALAEEEPRMEGWPCEDCEGVGYLDL